MENNGYQCVEASQKETLTKICFNISVPEKENKRKRTLDLQMATNVVPINALNIHKLGYLTWNSLLYMEKNEEAHQKKI